MGHTDYSQLKWRGRPLSELTDEEADNALTQALQITGALWHERQRRINIGKSKEKSDG